MLLGVAYELLSPVILILYSFSPPRGTTELDLGGRRSRLDVHEDGDASICSLLPMTTLRDPRARKASTSYRMEDVKRQLATV